MQIKYYPDGTSYIEVHKGETELTFRVNTYQDLWQLGQLVDACQSLGNRPSITIPCLIDAQADRRFGNGQNAGLKQVLSYLNNLEADFIIFHPHNAEVVENSLKNITILDNTKFIKEVLYLEELNAKNTVILAPDAGAFKSTIKLGEKLRWKGDIESASKARDYDVESGTYLTQRIDRQDFNGKNVLIVDDICVYGGTFKGLSKLLRERNVGKIILATSHHSTEHTPPHIDEIENTVDKYYTTNSKYNTYYKVIQDCPESNPKYNVRNINILNFEELYE